MRDFEIVKQCFVLVLGCEAGICQEIIDVPPFFQASIIEQLSASYFINFCRKDTEFCRYRQVCDKFSAYTRLDVLPSVPPSDEGWAKFDVFWCQKCSFFSRKCVVLGVLTRWLSHFNTLTSLFRHVEIADSGRGGFVSVWLSGRKKNGEGQSVTIGTINCVFFFTFRGRRGGE